MVDAFICRDGLPCDSPFGDGVCCKKFPSKFSFEGGCSYLCARLLLKGGAGWGMSLGEKVRR